MREQFSLFSLVNLECLLNKFLYIILQSLSRGDSKMIRFFLSAYLLKLVFLAGFPLRITLD